MVLNIKKAPFSTVAETAWLIILFIGFAITLLGMHGTTTHTGPATYTEIKIIFFGLGVVGIAIGAYLLKTKRFGIDLVMGIISLLTGLIIFVASIIY